MCDIILEFLYSSINTNFDILIYHLTDLSTYMENWTFYLPFLMILSDLQLFKSFYVPPARELVFSLQLTVAQCSIFRYRGVKCKN